MSWEGRAQRARVTCAASHSVPSLQAPSHQLAASRIWFHLETPWGTAAEGGGVRRRSWASSPTENVSDLWGGDSVAEPPGPWFRSRLPR